MTCFRVATGSLVLAACLPALYWHEIVSGEGMLSGAIYDGRIADALQLHWVRVFEGVEVWNRPAALVLHIKAQVYFGVRHHPNRVDLLAIGLAGRSPDDRVLGVNVASIDAE